MVVFFMFELKAWVVGGRLGVESALGDVCWTHAIVVGLGRVVTPQ